MESKGNSFATSWYTIMLDIKWKDHVSNTIIHAMTSTKPLVHCLRKRQLGFLGHIFRLPEDMLSTYHLMAKGDLDVHKLLIVHLEVYFLSFAGFFMLLPRTL